MPKIQKKISPLIVLTTL